MKKSVTDKLVEGFSHFIENVINDRANKKLYSKNETIKLDVGNELKQLYLFPHNGDIVVEESSDNYIYIVCVSESYEDKDAHTSIVNDEGTVCVKRIDNSVHKLELNVRLPNDIMKMISIKGENSEVVLKSLKCKHIEIYTSNEDIIAKNCKYELFRAETCNSHIKCIRNSKLCKEAIIDLKTINGDISVEVVNKKETYLLNAEAENGDIHIGIQGLKNNTSKSLKKDKDFENATVINAITNNGDIKIK